MKKPNSERIALTFGVLVFLFAIAFYISAWTEPPQTPPQGNVDTPINIGSAAQTKLGDLNIGSGLNYWLTKVGDSLALKNDSGINKFILGQDGNLILEGDITVGSATIKGDSSISSGLNSDLLDDYHASDLLAGSGSSSMPLQGNIVFRDNSSNYGISTIPLSLPAAGCSARITVCDYGNNPPTKLIIGADPVPSTVPTITSSSVSCGSFGQGSNSPSCSTQCDSSCNIGNTAYCENNDKCVILNTACLSLRINCDNYPRTCPYVNQKTNGRCCPADHPIYDATSDNCVKDSTVSTNSIGQCSVLSTTLEAGFTDVTFANSSGNPISTADYVVVGYSCPQ